MRWPTIVILITGLVVVSCNDDYKPPQPYGIESHYGGNGVAYAGQQGGVQFIREDVLGGGDSSSEEADISVFELPLEISAGLQQCLDETPPYNVPAYCVCLEEQSDELACTCAHLVCVNNPPDQTLVDAFLDSCMQQGFFTGICAGAGS